MEEKPETAGVPIGSIAYDGTHFIVIIVVITTAASGCLFQHTRVSAHGMERNWTGRPAA